MNDMIDRTVAIGIGGKDYKMLATVEALAAFYRLFDDLDQLANKMDASLESLCDIVVILCNAYKHNEDRRPGGKAQEELCRDDVAAELMPYEIIECKNKIAEAIRKGMFRTVEFDGDNESGNVSKN